MTIILPLNNLFVEKKKGKEEKEGRDGREGNKGISSEMANIFLGNKHSFISKWKSVQNKQYSEQEVHLIEIVSSQKYNVSIK